VTWTHWHVHAHTHARAHRCLWVFGAIYIATEPNPDKRIYTHMHMHTCTHTCTYTHTYMHAHMQTHTLYTHIHMPMHMHTGVCGRDPHPHRRQRHGAHDGRCVETHKFTHTHTHTRTHTLPTHTHTHTRTHTVIALDSTIASRRVLSFFPLYFDLGGGDPIHALLDRQCERPPKPPLHSSITFPPSPSCPLVPESCINRQ
jgi:hypothetical protein